MTARSEKAGKRLPAEKAELFSRLLEDPNVNELAELFLERGYDAGRARGVAEERLKRARERKGRKDVPKRPGRPWKIDPLMLRLLQRVVNKRSHGTTQAEAIKEFQGGYKQMLRDEGGLKLSVPFLDMDPESILAILRNRRAKKE